jgi:hypothetical protein
MHSNLEVLTAYKPDLHEILQLHTRKSCATVGRIGNSVKCNMDLIIIISSHSH